MGMINRDWNSRVIVAMSMSLPRRYSVEETKSIAVELGLVQVKELGLEKIIIDCDSFLTVQAVKLMNVRRVVGHIIKGIGQRCSSFQKAKVKHIDKDNKKIAHELTQHAKKTREKSVWRNEIPNYYYYYYYYY